MKLIETGFENLRLLEFSRFQDGRGVFSKLLDGTFFFENKIPTTLKQINHSITSTRGTVRGLHYQHPPFAEYKVITCLNGEVFDVVVDLRKNSKTFLRHFSFEMKASIPKALVVPPGFAHGFQAMTDAATLLYLHDQSYEPKAEAGLHASDEALQISWPLPVSGLSDRDNRFLNLDKSFEGFIL